MKHALIFSPYFDTWGGGEVYALRFGQCLSQLGYTVTLACPHQQTLVKARQYLGIKLSAHIDSQAYRTLSTPGKLWAKFKLTRKFDLTFFVSDGSLPFLFSKVNLVHFQVPFTTLKRTLLNQIKLLTINYLVCNSRFTQKVIDRKLAHRSVVIYPPVEPIPDSQINKQKLILTVGRFTRSLHHKRQDFLIEAFKNLTDLGVKDWQLVLIGSTGETGAGEYVEELKKKARGYPIKFLVNVKHQELVHYYRWARIFWLATGIDIDQTLHPELVEHFGISTVEAMSAGAIPIVANKGGQPEIVTDGVNGRLFNNQQELISLTTQLINSPETQQDLSNAAKKSAPQFSPENFCRQIAKLVP